MKQTYIFLALLFMFISISCFDTSNPSIVDTDSIPDKVDYNFHVRPILSDKCYACHGPDGNTLEANLRLDQKDYALSKLGDSEEYAIVPGKPNESKLVSRIMSDDSEQKMPPPDSDLSLTKSEKLILEKWIKQGAEWKEHWAYIPPQKTELPKINNKSWCEDEIDYFITEKHNSFNISPAPKADKAQWLRRVSFDITGLPPRAIDLDAFLQDDNDDAYENVVDRLLSSSSYGEHMASLWLDVARYADSHGYQDDRPRTSWPWRDWVIKAFNENLSYDQFATWQIAGDLLPNATYEQRLATGFNRNHPITQEGGVVQEEYLTEYASDRTNTFSTAFLGLTVECAKCHNHKYDPISQEEYYSLFSFFNNIPERGQISYFDEAPEPKMSMIDTAYENYIDHIKSWITKEEQSLQTLEKEEQIKFDTWHKDKYSKDDLSTSAMQELSTRFDLNEMINQQFTSKVENMPTGKMNINLPPHIPLPNQVQGRDGKALAFDGSNFLSIGEVGDFEWHDAFSYGGWVKHSGQHKKNAGIYARRVGEQKRQGYDLVLTPKNTLAARLIHNYVKKNKWSGDINEAIDVQTIQRMSANAWNHVFVTYDGSGKAKGLNIYLNGRRQQTKIIMDSLQNKTILNGNDFLVGNWNHRARETGDLYGFKGGSVDDVSVYDRMLTEAEVALLHDQSFEPNEAQLRSHYLEKVNPTINAAKNTLDSLRGIDLSIPELMVMEELDTIKKTYILNRGAYDAPTDEVKRATPKSVLAFDNKFENNRLGLAQWLFDNDNPLTSRVIVNRVWQMLFQQGIVSTPEDFGNQGALPTHPELLDWLAVDFRESGWDFKYLIKKIVLSATYRQDARINQKQQSKDPDNIWLARGPAQRLTAEMLRDQALAASDLYYEKVGGKWVKPYQPPGIWKELANQIGENKYRSSVGKNLYRRSLYSYWKRTIPPPSMLTFDASERAVCTVKRQNTSTPLQSLILLNAPLYVEASRHLANQILLNGYELSEQINTAFNRIVNRSPKQNEIDILTKLYHEELSRFEDKPEDAGELIEIGQTEIEGEVDHAALASLSIVVNTIFNLDEAKYK